MDGMRRGLLSPVALLLALFFSATAAFSSEDKVIVYYFHGGARCATCHRMEQYARESIEENFEKELADGTLVFKAVDVDAAGNGHFLEDYRLYTKALILSRVEDGNEVRHKDLTKIWEYVRDKERFFEYVVREVRDYLEGAGPDG